MNHFLSLSLALFIGACSPILAQVADVKVNPNTGALISPSAATFKSANGIGSGTGTVTSVSVTTANGVSGSVSNATSTPAITLSLGAITPTSINGNTITTGTGTLTLGAGKTATISNTLTLTGTDGSTLNVGAGGTLGTSAFITLGSGVGSALAINIGSAGAPVVLNGAGGTPSSLTLTNATGLPVSTGISGLGTGSATALAAGTSTGLAGAADSGKLAKYGTFGSLAASDQIVVTGVGGSAGKLLLHNPTGTFGTYILGGVATTDRVITTPNATGTLALREDALSVFSSTTSAQLATVLSDEEGSSGGLVRATGAALVPTTLAPTGAVTLSPANANVVISPAGTGAVTIAPATAGTVNNVSLGATTRGSGAFTTLAANAAVTLSASGAASAPAANVSGVPFAGTGTTSFPLVYINDANATASTALNTAGTYFGVNGDGTQDLMNLLKDGVSVFKVASTGAISSSETISITSGSKGIFNTAGNLYLGGAASNSTLIGSGSSFSTAQPVVLRNGVLQFMESSSVFLWWSSAGVLDVGTTAANQSGSIRALNATFGGVSTHNAGIVIGSGTLRLRNYTVATLPAGTQGDTAYVTDALAPAYMTAVVGGGAVVTPVFHDGTTWLAH